MPARFFEQDVRSGLKERRRLSAYLDELVDRHRDVSKTRLTYIFCNDQYLLQINSKFLDHDDYTDIITFDLGETSEELAGEIYISTERVRENAAKYDAPYEKELHRVIFHGALHLCGFKDKTTKDRKLMRQMEDQCLDEYFSAR